MVLSSRVRLGEMLVDAQLVTREQLDAVLAVQSRDGRRLGALLVEAGLVSEIQVTQLLSQQLSTPWVSLYHIDFSRRLLDLVSRELAETYCSIPVFVRKIRGIGSILYVAMDDPGDTTATQAIAEYSGLPVRAMIAPPTDIRSAIRAYYGGSDGDSDADGSVEALHAGRETIPDAIPFAELQARGIPTAMPSTPPEQPRRDEPAAESLDVGDSSSETQQSMRDGARPEDAPLASSGERRSAAEGERVGVAAPTVERSVPPRASEMPAPRQGAASRSVTLTLLDGTEIQLPARSSGESADHRGAKSQLTARDLIEALVATSHGADASEVLGDSQRWEGAFAALLSILLKKHLIADWEFAEEFQQLTRGRR